MYDQGITYILCVAFHKPPLISFTHDVHARIPSPPLSQCQGGIGLALDQRWASIPSVAAIDTDRFHKAILDLNYWRPSRNSPRSHRPISGYISILLYLVDYSKQTTKTYPLDYYHIFCPTPPNKTISYFC